MGWWEEGGGSGKGRNAGRRLFKTRTQHHRMVGKKRQETNLPRSRHIWHPTSHASSRTLAIKWKLQPCDPSI
eukprot:9138585-Pyramimonas_sp.AAC.1